MKYFLFLLFPILTVSVSMPAYADDEPKPSGFKWRAVHPVGKGKDPVNVGDPHSKTPKSGGTADVDKIAKGDPAKAQGTGIVLGTGHTPVSSKPGTAAGGAAQNAGAAAGGKAENGASANVGGFRPVHPLSPSGESMGYELGHTDEGILPPHNTGRGASLGEAFFGAPHVNNGEWVNGQLWRDFNAGKISKDTYVQRVRQVNDLESQYEAFRKKVFDLNVKDPYKFDKLKDYRKTINKAQDQASKGEKITGEDEPAKGKKVKGKSKGKRRRNGDDVFDGADRLKGKFKRKAGGIARTDQTPPVEENKQDDHDY